MIHLLYSNRTEALLDALERAVREERDQHGPWRTVRIVVPSPAIARLVELHLARRLGIAANLEFSFLDRFLRGFLPPETGLVDRPAIEGALLRRFRTGEGLDAGSLAPVRRFLGRPADPRRAAQLAYRLGGLMEEYLYSRPGWAPLWEQGRSALAGAGLEACERDLWNLVRTDLPAALATPREALDRLRAPADLGPVHLFGMTHLAVGYQALLDRVGRLAPGCLRFYALNPCREFWDDLETGPERSAARREGRRGLQDAAGADEAEEDPYGLQAPAESELLRRWGRPGREKIRLLNEMSDWDFEDGFQDPGRGTLLAALQQDLLFRRAAGEDPAPHDGTVQVHACPNPRREAETLCELIWEALRASEGSADPLRFGDVAVLVPAPALETYAAHLEAACGGAGPVPLSLVHRESPALGEALEAFALLLALPESPLSRAQVLGFLQHPAVRRRFPDADLEPWPGWCRDTGIVRGKDREDLQPAYFDQDILSWDQGHRRLALGAFLAQEGEPFAAGGELYPPRETGSGAWAEAGAFIRTTRSLLEDLRLLARQELPLQAWAARFRDLAAAWIGGQERADLAANDRLRQALLRLGSLDPGPGLAVAHPFRTARELALQELERLKGGQGRGRIQGVALGDLESLRGLPFRLMIVAGLDERAFPGRDAADDLDLRGRGRRPGDVPASERDRYLFLEALLSARERFVASFVARDPLTLEARQPSPVVLDLLEAAAAAARVPEEALVRAHPLLRWDPRRFAGDHPLLPVQPSVHLEARAELRYRHPPAAEPPPPDPALEPAPPWPGPALRPAVVPMGLHHLEAFLRSPLQGAARFALGLRDEEEDPGDMEEEAAAMAGLHAVPMLREAFWSARAGAGTPDQAYRRGRETFERAGLAPLGLLSGPERERHRRILEAWSAQVPETVPVRFPRLGPAALAPRGLPAEDLGVLTVPVRLGPGLVVELRGALAPQGDLGSGPGSVLLLTADSATPKAAAHHLVKAWVAHLVLAARAGTALAPRGYLVAGRAPRNGVRSVAFDALDAAGALDLLARLLADLLDHPHDTLLPLEALLELQDPADLPDWLEARAGREHGGYACLRGPVPNPGTFPPADAAAVARRMELLDPFLRALR